MQNGLKGAQRILKLFSENMSATIYDEIEIEDFDFDPELKTFYYPCPCGDRFQITEVSFKYDVLS